jgi:hypothetical protein
MTGTSLVFIVMPIIAPICLAALIALPFLAARNPSGIRLPRPQPEGACGEPDISAMIRPRFSHPR